MCYYDDTERGAYRFEEDYFNFLYNKKNCIGYNVAGKILFEIKNGYEIVRKDLFTNIPQKYKRPNKYQVKGFFKLFKNLKQVVQITDMNPSTITKLNNGKNHIDFFKWNFLLRIKGLENKCEDLNLLYET